MPRHIVKMNVDGEDYFLMWSTVVDAPVSYGLPLGEFKDYLLEEYGRYGVQSWMQALEEAQQKEVSNYLSDLNSLLGCNRAGKKGKTLTREEIVDQYIVQPRQPGFVEGAE